MQREHLIPMVDFTGVDPGSPAAWCAAREQVMQALGSQGGFEAAFDRVSPELRHALLEHATELFSLPLSTKQKNTSDEPYSGYLGQFPGMGFESLAITDVDVPHAIPTFAALMWPDGNPHFCEKAKQAAERLIELMEMVRRIVLESLGVAEYYDEQVRASYYRLRFTEYMAADDWSEEKRQLSYMAHRDVNTLSLVCQPNEVDGLHVETMDGEWALFTPRTAASIFVVAGEAFQAWTNGRVYAPLHGVRVEDKGGGGKKRYSMILFGIPTNERPIEARPELVDDLHPSLYNPFNYDDFLRSLAVDVGTRKRCKLAAYRREINNAACILTSVSLDIDQYLTPILYVAALKLTEI